MEDQEKWSPKNEGNVVVRGKSASLIYEGGEQKALGGEKRFSIPLQDYGGLTIYERLYLKKYAYRFDPTSHNSLSIKKASESTREYRTEQEPVGRLSANKAGVLLYSKKTIHRQSVGRPITSPQQFDSESEKQRYNSHVKKLEELHGMMLSKPDQQFQLALAVSS